MRKREGKYHSDEEFLDENQASNYVHMDEMVEDFLIRTRRLLLIGDIDEISSAHMCSNLQMMSSSEKPIYLYINSNGGCLSSGYAIIDQMRMCRGPVYTIVRGNAYSMGAMIAASGKKGHRYATPNSSFMLHGAIVQCASEPIGRHSIMVKYLERDYKDKILDLSKSMGIDPKSLQKLMDDTKWMNPMQAIEIGLIDRLWIPKMEQKICVEKVNDEADT